MRGWGRFRSWISSAACGTLLIGCNGQGDSDDDGWRVRMERVEIPRVDTTATGAFPREVLDRSEDGRIIFRTWEPHRIVVVSGDGRTIADLDEAGDGPGELHQVMDAGFHPDGGIWVLSPGGELVRFDDELEYVNRYFMGVHASDVTPVSDSRYFVAGFELPDVSTKSAADLSFSFMWHPSVGVQWRTPNWRGEEITRLDPFGGLRLVASDEDTGMLAVAPYTQYQVALLSSDGELLGVIGENDFPDRRDVAEEQIDGPSSMIYNISFDEDGHVRVLYTAPEQVGLRFWRGFTDRRDWLLDVWDPRRRELLARRRFDEPEIAEPNSDGVTFSIPPLRGGLDEVALLSLTPRRDQYDP